MSIDRFSWWSNLRHGGLLLDTPRLTALIPTDPADLSAFNQDRLRRRRAQFQDDATAHRGELISFVLESICGFARPLGEWYRGAEVKTQWSRKAITGESVRPRHLWIGKNGATLPVFVDDQHRIGVGKGRRVVSHVLGWLRQGKEQLALITNGQEWRLVFAGLDYEAFCQWDADSWFAEGSVSPELGGFRALVSPDLWTPAKEGEACPLLAAINNSRKGQADLSQILGERVRQAAELLIQAHTPALKEHIDNLASQDIYRAAVRMIMRLVVVLFAESREGLLARDNPVFHSAYSLQGLREQLERISHYKLVSGVGAYPRILGLLQLIYQGSSHPALPVPAYGGELFAPGRADDADGMKRALHLFETACFGEHQAVVMTDFHVRQILELLTRTKVKIRQGRATLLVPAPVDFSSLDSEYIGILYEGLLDFELRCAVQDEPIVFLAVGNQPALPLATLVQMDDRAIKNLLEKLKDTSSGGGEEESAEGEADDADEQEDAAEPEETAESDEAAEDETLEALDTPATDEQPDAEPAADDPRFSLKMRAEEWARRACQVGNLVTRPRGRATPESQLQYERALASKARQLVVKVVLPGEWYLVRWGGTRKGAGTFYTRPQLAIPTVHRTLRPLAYDPPLGTDGQPDFTAPAETWTPKKPEAILRLKVCDPACGSGSFPLSALRFLTNALYESLVVHGRIRDHGGRAVLDLIYDEETRATLSSEALPCRPDDDEFEPRTRAILRRYIVERCIYGVDLDPLAVELCRLSLWIETLDRSLPLTFLNHKIKCGNSLVGAWFDQFLHYPAMAWEREGGDKNHTNGVHLPKDGWTRAIKAFKARVKPDLIAFIDGRRLIYSVDLTTVRTGHDAAEAALAEIHNLGIAQVDQRAARYGLLQGSPEFQQLKAAFDLWCALWFWPADALEHAPLPTEFAAGEIDDVGREVARQVARKQRFFHWELEFPDVFNTSSHGFDAILGNPPWDVSKPNSHEFFSNIDPLYRSYGKQEAIRRQKAFFEVEHTERGWLDYNAAFKSMSNWVKFGGFPFGDRVKTKSDGKEEHDFNLGDRGRSSFASSGRRHARWKQKREESTGYADANHSFRHQGAADLNLYKLFLEQAHALAVNGGRIGFIVPAAVYSDFGSGALRKLFLDQCRWDWLFSFINWRKIFPGIYYRFKFAVLVVQKASVTQHVQTAFVRSNVEDWEHAEQFAVPFARALVDQFSPKSKVILELQGPQDLALLQRIYAASELLGSGDESWRSTYACEFHMTNDSALFPPCADWESAGYLPDEYSRWLKGEWKPIEMLYDEYEVAGTEIRANGELSSASAGLSCARVDIPEGVILSRDGRAYIVEDDISVERRTVRDTEGGEVELSVPAIALPLYEGRMIDQFDFSQKGWISGAGRTAVWQVNDFANKAILPQFLMLMFDAEQSIGARLGECRLAFIDVASATNARTAKATLSTRLPCGGSAPTLTLDQNGVTSLLKLLAVFNSFVADFVFRFHVGGLHLKPYHLESLPVPREGVVCQAAAELAATLTFITPFFAPEVLRFRGTNTVASSWLRQQALTPGERARRQAMLDAIIAVHYGIEESDLRSMFMNCDYSRAEIIRRVRGKNLPPNGFWRVDKGKDPEHRQSILTIVAFHDLQEKIAAGGGDVTVGIEAFCHQNDGEGWLLPETIRLADYGLGHDDRAREHQPVRECFGHRYYDWQLAQSAEESWRECHLHARNLLGPTGYQALIDEIEGRTPLTQPDRPTPTTPRNNGQQMLFETADQPLFDE